MNDKSKTVQTAFGITEENFKNMLKEQERLSNESFEDEALNKFVKEPKNLSLYGRVKTKLDFALLFLLFAIIFLVSIIGGLRNSMESYVAFPIAILCLIGFVILIKDMKGKNRNE